MPHGPDGRAGSGVFGLSRSGARWGALAMTTVRGPSEQFVSEPMAPARGSFDLGGMSRGEPGLPGRFTWRGASHVVAVLQSTWKTSTADRGEQYLRRHWYRIVTADGRQMTLYCERQVRSARRPATRWWVYSASDVPPRPT